MKIKKNQGSDNKTPLVRFPEFKNEWEVKKLGEICEFTQGVQIPQSEQIKKFEKGYIRYLYIRDFFSDNFKCFVKDVYPNKIIKIDEIMVVNTGNTAGKVFTGSTGVLSNNSFKLTNKKIINSIFLFTILNSFIGQNRIKRLFNVGGQPHLGHKNIARVIINFPTLPEQKKIAHFFTTIDKKINQLQDKKNALEQYKKGIMQQIFSQQLRFKDDTSTTLSTGNGQDFPDWEVKKLGEVCKFLDNKRKPIKSGDRLKMKGKYPYYGASGIIDYVNNYLFDEELILLGEDGENIISRNSPLAFRVSGKCWINNHAHVIQPKSNYNIDFLTVSLENINYVKYNTGTAQPKLNQEICRSIPLKFPILKEQTKIANFLSKIDDKINNVNEQIEITKTYKKGLLQKMFV